MDAVALLIGLAVAGYVLYLIGRAWKSKGHPPWLWIVIVLCGLVFGVTPVLLIKEDVLQSSVPNIVIAGLAIFYFAFVIGRMSKKLYRRDQVI